MSYMVVEKFRLLISLIFTKVYFPKAKIVRFPSVFRGKRYFKYGRGFVSGYNCRIDVVDNVNNLDFVIDFGSNVQINDSVHIAAGKKILIGNDVLIASRVFITDHNHGSFPEENEFLIPVAHRKLSFNSVIIHDNVWLGEGVFVMPGVTIGKNSIIGAGSVVTKSIPENVIAVGNPAKIIKSFCLESNSWRTVG
ncbi:TPA: acetyltransferase [Vibrio parahaemolyticus]|uniref:DapH/DapD/GlmU-related protein n=1 Tax=Vibrio parahaemolyticus TaxID=670 RepID=UPI0011245219|nr:DapH/DapD/GlmU-related protein [Vibrio parahaemolyticus]EGQ7766529.1 acetyltransferase [Vibrio parahaemolyticus]EGQ7781296.1 acetyltransferase [Vibrio parahaemolyticus]EIV1637126.1 acetyltransferase [Vibrio parahaemolyticus]EIV8667005.1 acetyltransferase [Vibrio parahaemolyticus]MBE3773232.1 acetyltransferase [Vibrio parahaemolyticus]